MNPSHTYIIGGKKIRIPLSSLSNPINKWGKSAEQHILLETNVVITNLIFRTK